MSTKGLPGASRTLLGLFPDKLKFVKLKFDIAWKPLFEICAKINKHVILI